MRGEHYGSILLISALPGSSPHARGTLSHRRMRGDGMGIIPACAGNTVGRLIVPFRCWDHPRMRGEHRWQSIGNNGWRGSSPHARGTRSEQQAYEHDHGIIPACAGNTVSPTPTSRRKRDHPRMRGEHPCNDFLAALQGGSSPHARGTHVYFVAVKNRRGIIPACAGNTRSRANCTCSCRDHPRMRGEHSL